MATITSLGIGSGIDINSIVTQLVALERRPLQLMQTDATRLREQVSSFGKMQSLFSGLQTASNALTSASLWSRSAATSSDAPADPIASANEARARSAICTAWLTWFRAMANSAAARD